MTDNISATGADGVETRVLVSGMTCAHCVASVTEEVSTLAGVHGVSVDLNPEAASTVTVTSASALDPGELRDAIAEAGYDLVDA
jgi:copper chaperone